MPETLGGRMKAYPSIQRESRLPAPPVIFFAPAKKMLCATFHTLLSIRYLSYATFHTLL